MRNSTIMAMADMRKRIADNKATPDEIATFEAQAAEQGQRMNERFDQMVDQAAGGAS
jgi:hypothetical protein